MVVVTSTGASMVEGESKNGDNASAPEESSYGLLPLQQVIYD